MRPYACHRLPSDFCNVALFVLQSWECERSLYSRQVAIGATQQKQRFFNLFCSFVFPFVENCNVAFLVFVFPIVETATLQSFVLFRGNANARLFPVHCNRGNVPKTENSQGLSPILFSFRRKCNVAIKPLFVFPSVEKRTFGYLLPYGSRPYLYRIAVFQGYRHYICVPFSLQCEMQRCICFVFCFYEKRAFVLRFATA